MPGLMGWHMVTRMHKSRSLPLKEPAWDLCLYIAGRTQRSLLAYENLKGICEKYLSRHCRIEIVDVLAHPGAARADNIVAIPTLVRKAPRPIRCVIGTLSDSERVISGLEMAGRV